MICADGLNDYCYPILTNIIVNSKEQVLITGIKTNAQFFVCHVFL